MGFERGGGGASRFFLCFWDVFEAKVGGAGIFRGLGLRLGLGELVGAGEASVGLFEGEEASGETG